MILLLKSHYTKLALQKILRERFHSKCMVEEEIIEDPTEEHEDTGNTGDTEIEEDKINILFKIKFTKN